MKHQKKIEISNKNTESPLIVDDLRCFFHYKFDLGKFGPKKKIPCEIPIPFQSQARRRHSPSCRWRSPATAEVPRRPPAQRRRPPSPTREASGAPGGDEPGHRVKMGSFWPRKLDFNHSLTNQNGELTIGDLNWDLSSHVWGLNQNLCWGCDWCPPTKMVI